MTALSIVNCAFPMTDKTYSADEAATYLKVHRNTVLKLARSGELRAGKVGRRWVFIKEDLQEYLDRVIAAQVEKRRAAQSPLVICPPRRRRAQRPLCELPDLPDWSPES